MCEGGEGDRGERCEREGDIDGGGRVCVSERGRGVRDSVCVRERGGER